MTDTGPKTSPANRRYAYSFDRERFVGTFPDRAAALTAATAALDDQHAAPEGIYIGREVPIDWHVMGHAPLVIEELHRAFDEQRDGDKLKRFDENDVADLETRLATCLSDWLERRDLVKRVPVYEAISEHPVPLKRHVPQTNRLEVGPLGEA